jgi:hypothetical protein
MISKFVERIDKFFDLPHSEKITIFGYFLTIEKGAEFFNAKQIKECYETLRLQPYTNIPAHIKANSKGKSAKFLVKKDGYTLSYISIKNIKERIGDTPKPKATNSLIDLTLFNNTRGYLQTIFDEACCAYDAKLPTSALVMLRKGVEVLIIDLYEKKNEKTKIMDPKTAQYYFLSNLIDVIKKDTDIKLNRNCDTGLDKIKSYGDMSAHGRFTAKISDVDKLKDCLRIVVDDLLNKIDYPNWKK